MNWRVGFAIYVALISFILITCYDFVLAFIMALSLCGAVTIGYLSGKKGD